MNQSPREVIQSAIEEWWLSTDPAAPFDPTEAADQIDTYLDGCGYTISRRMVTYSVPSRPHIAFTAFLALVCLLGTVTSLAQLDWGWTTVSLVGTGIFTKELLDELAERRRRSRV